MTGPLARVMSLATLSVGIALVASTIARGGGPLSVGVVVGVLLVLAGAGRLYVEVRR